MNCMVRLKIHISHPALFVSSVYCHPMPNTLLMEEFQHQFIPVIYRGFYTSQVVVWDFFHQQYVVVLGFYDALMQPTTLYLVVMLIDASLVLEISSWNGLRCISWNIYECFPPGCDKKTPLQS